VILLTSLQAIGNLIKLHWLKKRVKTQKKSLNTILALYYWN